MKLGLMVYFWEASMPTSSNPWISLPWLLLTFPPRRMNAHLVLVMGNEHMSGVSDERHMRFLVW